MIDFNKFINEDLSRTQQVKALQDNDNILNGRLAEQEFADNEISTLYSTLGLGHRYTRKFPLGNTATTYGSWVHYQSENGYSIWSYPLTDFRDGASNLLMMDSVAYDYKGQADSLAETSFTKVLNYFAGEKLDHTTEAASVNGTAFSFLQGIDGATYCLYLGSASTFKAIDFDLETNGGGLDLALNYWNGSEWADWDGSCALANFIDNTENMHYNGRIEFDLPTGWTTKSIDGTTAYWVKIMTNNSPTQVPYAYHILPGNSVPSLLALSQKQVVEKDWAWCYFNNNIYAVIPNSGDSYYEGDLFVKSSSSTENKQNFFISNHLFEVSYENTGFTANIGTGVVVSTKAVVSAIPVTTRQAYIVTDVGDFGALAVSDGATWLAILVSAPLGGLS